MTGRRVAGFLAKWTLLAAVALVAGGSLGVAFTLATAPPPEELTDHELRRGDVWPPTAPVLLAPANGETVTTLTPVFEWQASSDNRPRLIYVLEFGTDERFQSGFFRTVSNIEDTRWETPPEHPFPPATTMYWRAYAIDEGLNQGPYSETWSFTALPVDLPVALPLR